MDAPSSVSPLSSSSAAHFSSATSATPDDLINKAILKIPIISDACDLLEVAYKTIRTYSKPLHPSQNFSLYTLFHTYAKYTCYAQEGADGDAEEGFRKSARLMELSLTLQLNFFGLAGVDYDWAQYPTLEALLGSLEVQKDQKGILFDSITQTLIDPDALLACSKHLSMQEVVAKTLTVLSYSYQNIDALEKYHTLHTKFNDLTEKLIGSETLEQKKALIDYKYNRCCFLVGLQKPNDFVAQLASYEPIKIKIAELWQAGDPDGESLLAQTENMQGLLLLRSGSKDALQRSEQNFISAFTRRSSIVDKFSKDKERWDQRFLLCNIRTALIKCNLTLRPDDPASIESAYVHAQELRKFLADAALRGNQHCYLSGYMPLILQAEQAKSNLTLASSLTDATTKSTP